MSPSRRTILGVAIVAVSLAAIAAGRWQLRRLAARRVSNAVFAHTGALPPLELPKDLPPSNMIDSGRRVVAHGHFDQPSIFLRGRVQNDGPGIQVVTPFVLDGTNTTLWVLRGFVASPDAVTPPDPLPAADTGLVAIEGIALATPVTNDSGAPVEHRGDTTFKRLDRGTLERRRPGTLPVYLLLTRNAPGDTLVSLVPPPELNDGPHLSYALQWFGIALAVFTFGVVIFWRDGRALPPRHEAP